MAYAAVAAQGFKQADNFLNFYKAFFVLKAVIFDDGFYFLQSLKHSSSIISLAFIFRLGKLISMFSFSKTAASISLYKSIK